MKPSWLFTLTMILLAGCGQASMNVVVVYPADLTATAVFVPPVGASGSGAAATPIPTPDPDRCTANNALGVEIYLRNYPGPQHDVISTWLPNVPLEVIGSTDNGWYLLHIPPDGRGWVSDEVSRLSGNCRGLPVLTSASLRSPDYKLPCRVSSASGGSTELFSLPAFDSQTVGELPQGYLMEARQHTQGGWYYLIDFLGMLPQTWNQGWAYESTLHLNGGCGGLSAEAPPTSAAVILASGETVPTGCTGRNTGPSRIDLFAEASPESPLLSWILPGESVRLSLRNAQGWVMAEFDAFRGWARTEALQLSDGCSDLPELP